MSNKQQPIDSDLLECWQQSTPNKEQYLQEHQIIQWILRVFKRKRIIMLDSQVQKQIKQYGQLKHGLGYNTVIKVTYDKNKACDFYEWITKKKQIQQQNDEEKEEGNQGQGKEQLENEQQFKQLLSQKRLISQSKQQPNQSFPELIQNQFQQLNKVEEGHATSVPKICKNYQEYLSTIFEHYCRMSYATGSDPTFEQIQQKTQVMTINKFMIFCKDFSILGGKKVSRAVLVQLFKKNAKFYKEMNEQQFVDVLKKIADLFYGDNQQQTNSHKYERLLVFMEVDSLSNFKKKSATLGIVLKPKLTQSNNPPPPLILHKSIRAHKTKLNQTQNNDEGIVSTQKIRSESKMKKQPLLLRNPSMKRYQPNQSPHTKSFQALKQQQHPLPPPIPPSRKISQTVTRPPADPAITGYANIHRLKNGRSSNLETKLKLNPVVEQAKKMIYYQQDTGINRISEYSRQTPYSQYSNHPQANIQNFSQETESEQANSRQQIQSSFANSKVVKSYAPYAHSQLSKSKNVGNSKIARDLHGIIGNDSDEDEYLQQHLNRERKNNAVGERISRKIKELEQKIELQ